MAYLKVGICVTGLLLVIAAIASLISQHCPEERINFNEPSDSEVTVVEVPCGAHQAYIPCNYTILINEDYLKPLRAAIPDWIINSTTYSKSSLPQGFRIHSTSLVVTDISKSWLNNTFFFCQLQLQSETNPEISCIYNSSARQLIINKCEAPRIECIPVYSHQRNGSLQRIHTILNLTNLEVDGTATGYTIIYTNSECDAFTIDPVNCVGSICRHEFDIPSWCSNVTNNISVVVSTTNSNTSINFWKSETIEIDTSNRFVNILVDMRGSGESSAIRCFFLDQLISNVKRYCGIKHGPDCSNLYPLVENYVTNTESIKLDIDLSYLGNGTELCISVVAETGNKRVKIEGMYDISKLNRQTTIEISTIVYESAFQIQTSLTHVGSIGLLITILMMYVI